MHFRASLPSDIGYLAERLREADKAEVIASGMTPMGALTEGYNLSRPYCVTWAEEDGTPVAMFGLVPQADNSALIWLLGSSTILNHVKEFLRAAREFIHGASLNYLKLWNVVHEDNSIHIRWLKWAGFSVSEGHLEHNGHKFRYFERLSPVCVIP